MADDYKLSVYAGISIPAPYIHQYYQVWNSEFPEQIKYASVKEAAEKMRGEFANDTILVAHEENELVGWLSLSKREDDQIWITMLVNNRYQKQGVGTLMLEKAKGIHEELHGWVIKVASYKKVDGKKYVSPLAFYTKNGFSETKNKIDQNGIKAIEVVWSK